MQRKSSLELLRILCILGIIAMHLFGEFSNVALGNVRIFGVFFSTLFNTGVSIFMLISGYFGVKFSLKK